MKFCEPAEIFVRVQALDSELIVTLALYEINYVPLDRILNWQLVVLVERVTYFVYGVLVAAVY